MTPPEQPAASVVVATYNRIERLRTLLTALEQQVVPGPFEVIVVDDASTDDTWAELQRLAADGPLRLRPLRLEHNSGPATARNAGWRAAAAPVVCFTDDDCLPQAGWLDGLLRGIATADIVQGRTEPDPAHADRRGPFSHTIWVPFEQGYYETCNIAYRREVLVRLDGFDESFRNRSNGEDIDLAWRAKESGARTAFAEDALVFHEITPSDYKAFVREIARRPTLVRAFRDHPDVRTFLKKGIFFRPTHPRALAVTAAGIAVLARPQSPVRWAAAAGLGLSYAWDIRKFRPKPARKYEWAAVVPLSLAAELYEIGVMARASVRYRTVLL
jgi:glycosyltransferase involved in cell wall biosynthesis